MNQDPDRHKNVVHIESARKQRAQKKGKKALGTSHGTSNPRARIWSIIQVIIFLLFVSYFMKLCQGH